MTVCKQTLAVLQWLRAPQIEKKEVHFLSVHFGTAQPLKVLNIGSWNE